MSCKIHISHNQLAYVDENSPLYTGLCNVYRCNWGSNTLMQGLQVSYWRGVLTPVTPAALTPMEQNIVSDYVQRADRLR